MSLQSFGQIARKLEGSPFVICDLVRAEESGKHLLIGAYPANVIVPQAFPAAVSCTVWSAFHALAVGHHAAEYRFVKSPEGTVLAAGQTSFDIRISDVQSCVLGVTFNVASPTTVDVQLRFESEEWFSLGSFRVRRAEPGPGDLPQIGAVPI